MAEAEKGQKATPRHGLADRVEIRYQDYRDVVDRRETGVRQPVHHLEGGTNAVSRVAEVVPSNLLV
ncbi:MAG: hypothetical protein M3P01_04025 [Actinomycetota bacterium]|nr:hypothetical protein [Actinomycetota bacterium]